MQPGVAAGVVDPTDIVATLAVGYSGAGKKLATNLLASEGLGAAVPYAVGGTHRHIPEIVQNLLSAGADDVRISFTPGARADVAGNPRDRDGAARCRS